MVYEGYQDYFDKKLIISVATTGGLHGKDSNPNLPEQPQEIVDDLIECRDAGASIVHLHVRDEDGKDTKNPERFQEFQDVIQDNCGDILVNFTTGGDFSREERINRVVETERRPEIATIDVGPMTFGQTRTHTNPREQNVEYTRQLQNHNIKPEIEIFNQGHIPEAKYLIEQGLLDEPYWFSLILGMQTGTPPHPRNLINLIENIPEGTEWQCLATGKHQLPLTTISIALGGHVRTGLEDNIYYKKGELAKSNAQLVRRTARIAKELERPIATPSEARNILNID
jgi:3-keto-5-aminohexanoate cleavage enzyme